MVWDLVPEVFSEANFLQSVLTRISFYSKRGFGFLLCDAFATWISKMLTLCHGVLQNTAFDEIAHFT